MAGVSMDAELDKADLKKLERFAGQVGRTLPLMRTIGSYMRDATRQRFRTQRGPDGAPWKPSLRAQLSGGATLVEHGILRDSYNDQATDQTAIVGSADIRARIHHFGGKIAAKAGGALKFRLPGGGFVSVKSVVMPARPALGVSGEDRIEISALVQDFIDLSASGAAA